MQPKQFKNEQQTAEDSVVEQISAQADSASQEETKDYPFIELITERMVAGDHSSLGCEYWLEQVSINKLQFIDGRFTGLPRTECLVIFYNDENAPSANYGYYAMLCYKDGNNAWKNVSDIAFSRGFPPQSFALALPHNPVPIPS